MCLLRFAQFTCGCRSPAYVDERWITLCRRGKVSPNAECAERRAKTYAISFPCHACYQGERKQTDLAVDFEKLLLGEEEKKKEGTSDLKGQVLVQEEMSDEQLLGPASV